MKFLLHKIANQHTDTSMRVKPEIARLSKYWFVTKFKDFESHCKDGNSYYIADHTPPGYVEYLQCLTDEERANESNDFYQTVDLKTFCYNPGLSDINLCGRDIVDTIIVAVRGIIDDAGISDNYDGFKSALDDVRGWVNDECNELMLRFPDDNYCSVITDFQSKCLWQIDYQFSPKLSAMERYIPKTVDNVEPKQEGPSWAALGIMHVYLAEYERQPVTENNKIRLAGEYGGKRKTSGKQLKDEFDKANKIRTDELRTDRQMKIHLQRLQSILPMLQLKSAKAYQAVEKDIAALQKKMK